MPHKLVNGVNLFYEETGSGPAVLLHHGYTGSHDNWLGVAPRLAANGCRAIVMDARGAGDSEHPPSGYTIEQYAADVAGMADALGLGRFTYVGHSMGGVIGMELGMSYAARLERLVLVAPAPADGIETPPGYFETAKAAWTARDAGAHAQQRVLLSARDVESSWLMTLVNRQLSVSEGHYDESWAAMVDYHKGDRLGEITTPTLLMAGAADGLLRANLTDFMRLPNATLHVFSRVSHGLPYEVPEEFTEVLLDFLEHGVVNASTLQDRLRAAAAAL